MYLAIVAEKINFRKTAFLNKMNAQSQIFSEALMNQHGIKAKIQFSLTCRFRPRFVAYTIDADGGILSSINYWLHPLCDENSSCYRYDIFEKIPLVDQVGSFLYSINYYLINYGPHYYRLKGAIEDHAMLDENRLGSIRLGLAQKSTDYFSVEFSWDGFGNDLEFGRQYEANDVYAKPEEIYEVARKLLARMNQRDTAREARRKRGLRPDRPLAAMLRDMNSTCEELYHAAKLHGFADSRKWQEPTPDPMDFNGKSLSIKFRNGDMLSKFKLSENVTWNDGNLKIVGIDLPDALIANCKGRKLREIVDHPWLDGLLITHANSAIKKDRTKMINFNTREI